jgi:anti-anti-sigma factor
MSLHIEEKEREGVVILKLDGRITVGKETTALRSATDALNSAGQRNLVLDLAKVDYIEIKTFDILSFVQQMKQEE